MFALDDAIKDHAIIRWTCGIKERNEAPPASPLHKHGIEDITSVLHYRRLRCYGYYRGLHNVSNLSQTFRFPAIENKEGHGRHGLNVWKLMSVSKCGLACVDPQDRDVCRAGVRHSLVLSTHRMGHWRHLNLKWNWMDHDDFIKWKHVPRNWPFVREIHRSPVNFPHTGQWRGALMFSVIYAWINDWVNNREAGDLRHQHGHYDVIVMWRFVLECLL